MPDENRAGVAGQSQKSIFWRQFVAISVALLFGLSNYFVQSHVHIPTSLTIGSHASYQDHGPKSGAGLKLQSHNDDPADCPLCQADIMSGAFVTPAPVVFVPIIAYVLTVFLPIAHGVRLTHLSHNWQGRAPPSL
jgi:hypothetical protein